MEGKTNYRPRRLDGLYQRATSAVVDTWKNHPFRIPVLLIIGVLIFAGASLYKNPVHLAHASACSTTGSGNWSATTGVWTGCSGGGTTPPTSADTVSIGAGHSITLDTDATVQSVTMNATGTLTNNGVNHTLSLNGTSGTLFTPSGTFTPSTFITIAVTSASGSPTLLGASKTFYKLTINAAATVINMGAFTPTIAANGTLYIQSGVFNMSGASVTGPGSGSGTFQIDSGGVACFGGTTASTTATCDSGVSDTATRNMPTFQTYTFDAASTVYWLSDVAQTVDSLSAAHYGNLELRPKITASRIYTLGNGALNIDGNLTVNPTSGSTFTLTVNIGTTSTTTVAAGKTTTVKCQATTASATFVTNTNSFNTGKLKLDRTVACTITFTLSGTDTMTLTGTSGTLFSRVGTTTFTATTSSVKVTSASGSPTLLDTATTFCNFMDDHTGVTLAAGKAITITSSASCTLEIKNGTLDDGGNQMVGGALALWKVDAGAQINFGSAATATTVPTNFTAANSTINVTSTVLFQAGVNQTWTGTSSTAFTYGNVTFTPLSGTPVYSLSAATNVNGNVNVTAGFLTDAGFQITGPGNGTSKTFTLAASTKFCLASATATCPTTGTTATSANNTTMPVFATYTFNSSSEVHYQSSITAAQVISAIASQHYGNLYIDPTLTAATAITVSAASATVNIDGDFFIKPRKSTTSVTMTVTLGGAIAMGSTHILTMACGNTTAGVSLTTSASGFAITAGKILMDATTVACNAMSLLANSSTITLNATSGTLLSRLGTTTFTAGTSTITATNASGTPTLNNAALAAHIVTINDSGAGVIAGAAVTLDGVTSSALNVTAGTFDDGGFQTIFSANTSCSVTVSASAQINFGSAATATTIPTVCTTMTFNSTSTALYEAGVAQNVGRAALTTTYGNLTFTPLSGTPTFRMVATATVAGNLTLNAGTLDDQDFQITGPGASNTFTLAASTTLCFGSGATACTTSGTTATKMPTFNAYSFNASSTVKYVNNVDLTSTNAISSAPAYGNLSFLPTITAGHAYTFSGATTVHGNLTINPGTAANLLTVNLAGNLTLDSTATLQITRTTSATAKIITRPVSTDWNITTGALDIEAGATLDNTSAASVISVAGNYTNNGTFTKGSSEVILNGTAQQTLTGTMTTTSAFNNLTITNNSGAGATNCELGGWTPSIIFSAAATANVYKIVTASVRVQYLTGTTYTFTTINWNGQAAGTPIYFRNSAASASWTLTYTNKTAVDNLNVSRSNATPTTVVADSSNVIDCGNNTAWTFKFGISGTTNEADSLSVHWAKNNTAQGEVGSTSSGAWSIINTAVTLTNGDVVTVWLDNVADSLESTAITTYITGGTNSVSGMVLNTNVLTIGSNQNNNTSVTNASQYTCGSDEDVMDNVISSVLSVQGSSCFGSTTNSYADPTINILASNTLTISGTETLTTDNLTIAGTLTSGGNSTYNVSGSYTNTGTFTASTSTINFTSTTTETVNSTGASLATFNNLVFNGSGGQWTLSPAVTAATITSTAGTITGSNDVTLTGAAFTCGASCGTVNMTGGTFNINGAGNFGTAALASNWTFNNLSLGGSSATTTAQGTGTITVAGVLTVGAGNTLQAGGKTYALTGSGTPFVATGTFTAQTSTFSYEGTTATTPVTTTYNNLQFNPASGTPTYTLPGLSAGVATKINDAANFSALSHSRQILRTSGNTLYAIVIDTAVTTGVESWKSTDNGVTWIQKDNTHRPQGYNSVSAAIDGAGVIHIVLGGFSEVDYNTFNTSTDLFGASAEIITTCSNQCGQASIAVDSANKPHVAMYRNNLASKSISYSNRTSGSWGTIVTVFANGSTDTLSSPSITIDEDDLPEVSLVDDTTTTLKAAVGNVNNATSFTVFNVDTTVNVTADQKGSSIGVDSSGNTWVAYIDGTSNNVTLDKRTDGSETSSWSTGWQATVSDSHTGKEPSLAINGTDIYVFYQNSADDVTYDKYTGSWLGETTLETGTYQKVNAKWSFNFNNNGSSVIDYGYSDGTDVYWHSLVIGTSTVVANNLTLVNSGGTATVDASAQNPGITVSGDFAINKGTFTASASGTFNIAGSYTNCASCTFTHSSGTVTFNGTAGGKTIDSGGDAFYNQTFSGSGGGWTLTNNGETVSNNLAITTGTLDDGGNQIVGNASGTLTAGASGTLKLGDGSATTWPTLFTAGNTTLNSASTVVYQASTAQNVGRASTTITYGNLTIDSVGSASVKTSLATLTVAGALAINNGNTFDDGGFQITGNGSGNLTAAASSSLNLGSAGTATTFPTSFTNGHTTLNVTSTVVYQAGANQTISGTPTYGNLTATPLSGTPIYSLAAATAVNGNLTVNGGFISDAGFALTGPGSGTGKTFTVAASAEYCFGAATASCTTSSTNATIMPTFASYAFSATSTVAYLNNVDLTSGNVISVTPAYGNLQLIPALSASRTYTFASGAITINGNFDIKPASGTAGSQVLTVNPAGDITVGATKTTTIKPGSSNNPAATLDLRPASTDYNLTTGLLVLDSLGTGQGTLDCTSAASTITLDATSGTLLTRGTNGVFTQGSSTVSVTSASGTPTLLSAATTFHILTMNATGVTLSAGASPTIENASGAALTITAGTFDEAGNQITGPGSGNGTFTIGASGTFKLGAGTGTTMPTFQTYTFNSSSTTIYNATVTQTISGTPGYGNLQLSRASGTPTKTPDANLTVNGNLTIDASNTLDMDNTNNRSLTLKGNYTNNGSFTARAGLVTLSGTSGQTLSGGMLTTNAFYDLTISNSSGASASDDELTGFTASVVFSTDATASHNYTVTTNDVRVQYHSGSTYTFANINWSAASSHLIYFRNSAASGTWLLKVTGTQTAVHYVNVSRSDASVSGGSTIVATDGTNHDGSNNTNWTFSVSGFTLAGTVYATDESTPISGTPSVRVKVNGAGSFAANAASGAYSIPNVVMNAGDALTIYLDTAGGVTGATFTVSTGAAMSNIDIYQDRAAMRCDNSCSLTNANIDQWDKNNDTDIHATSTTSPYNLTVDNDWKILVKANTYAPGGTVTTSAGGSNSYSGDVEIKSGATFNIAANALSIGGSYNNGGTLTASNTTTFTATGSGKTLAGTMTGGSAFNNVVFDGSSGTWSFGANAAAIKDLTLTNGTVTAPSSTLTLTGNYTNNAVFTHNSGTVTVAGSTQQTLDGTMTSGSAFNNLTFTNTTGTDDPACGSSFTPSIIFNTAATTVATFTITTAHVRVQYHSGSAYTFNNVNWDGGSTLTRIQFRNSSLSSGTWLLNVTAVGNAQTKISSVDVARSDATSGAQIIASDGTNQDCNNNTNWMFNESLTLSLNSSSVSFGVIQPASNPSDQTTTLTTTTNANTGYVIYAWATQPLTYSSFTISDWSGTNASPTTFSAGSFGFGYTTDDSSLTGGTANRFTNGGAKYAGFAHTGPTSAANNPVADATAPVTSDAHIVSYRLYPSTVQTAQTYSTVIIYVAAAKFP